MKIKVASIHSAILRYKLLRYWSKYNKFMNIRTKLSILFSIIIGSILLIFTTSIYYFSSSYRTNDYQKRLTDRAKTTARLLLDVKEVDETLLKIIDKNSLALYQEQIFILDENNSQIYSNIEDSLFQDKEIINEINQNKIYEFKQGERDAIGLLYEFENHNYVVIASAFDIYGIAKIKNLKIILISGFFLSMFISVIAGLLFSGRALAPISAVVKQVKKISITNLNLRVDEGNKKDEIAQLAMTFNQMLQRLEEAFVLQREFVSNAAHELRTPFTVMLAEIDLSLMHDRTKEHYVLTLKNLSKEIKNLSKLSNGLLDLARISFDNSNFELRNIRVDELLIETCNDVFRMNKEAKVNFEFENLTDDESSLCILGNEQLIKTAIKNLVENACKFSNDKKVNISLTASESSLKIEIHDTGIGIATEDIDKVFQPFYRGKNTHFFSGYGLGLALAMKIVQLHNGNISVKSEIGVGSEFVISLPNRFNF